MIFVFTSSIMAGALAQNSNPSDTLFPIKRILEKIELAFISNPVSKAEFRLDIAGERLKYLETSINQEDSLSTVLTESQIALVDARTALNNAKAVELEEGDDQGIPALIERFSKLLNDQKNILNNIDKNIDGTDEDTKNVMLAIRETIAEDAVNDIDLNSPEEVNNPVDKKIVQPTDGPVVLRGIMGSYTAKPVIIVDNIRYFLLGSSVDLIPYMGLENAIVYGTLEGDNITITKLLISGKVIWEARVNIIPETPAILPPPDSTDK